MDKPGSRNLIVLLTALVALGPVSVTLYLPSMPALGVEFQTDTGQVQQSFTIFLAGFAAAQLVYGPLADRFGRRPVLIGGLLLYIAGSLACAMSTAIDTFLLARLTQGLGACVGPVVARAIVRDKFERSDAVRAFASNKKLWVRSPDAVRPWQHVLDPVRGLLVLAEQLDG